VEFLVAFIAPVLVLADAGQLAGNNDFYTVDLAKRDESFC